MRLFGFELECQGELQMGRRREGSNAVPNLPLEIIMVILSRLAVKCLLRFRCVCKSWCKLITEPSFVEMHLSRSIENNLTLIIKEHLSDYYSIDYDACFDEERAAKISLTWFPGFSIFGSCNGLLCLGNKNNAILWNPSTREFKKFPDFPVEFQGLMDGSWGFGYDGKAKEYKVIRIVNIHNGFDMLPHQAQAIVCTLGNDLWRSLGNVPWSTGNGGVAVAKVVGGVPHWIVCKGGPNYQIMISSFDVGVEEFREVQWPIKDCNVQEFCLKSKIHLCVLGGCLSFLYNKSGIEIYVMKEYGIRESWTKQFTIGQPKMDLDLLYSMPFGFSKNGEILLLEKFWSKLLEYNPENDMVRVVKSEGYPCLFILGSYTESLVSLESKNGIEEPQQV